MKLELRERMSLLEKRERRLKILKVKKLKDVISWSHRSPLLLLLFPLFPQVFERSCSISCCSQDLREQKEMIWSLLRKERKGKSWREDLRAREGERDERGQMTFKIPSEERRDEGRTEVTLTE
jgi:hypothetical protein